MLELTETAMFQDTEATIVKLEALRARGVRIAIDDFGTGYSSLGYLRRFPVDILKIARDFVVQPDLEQSEWAFAHAIVALGQTLGLHIIAEGIEEPRQVERLLQLGCEFGQGFPHRAPRSRPAIRTRSVSPTWRAPPSRRAAAVRGDVEGRVLMFILYAVPLGLVVGPPARRQRWPASARSVPVGRARAVRLCRQVVLFSDPVTARVGDLGPPLYVASTAARVRGRPAQLAIRGMPLVAAGAASNLAAIVANGGYMPTSASAAAEFDGARQRRTRTAPSSSRRRSPR